MSIYESIPQQVEAEQFDGTDVRNIISLAGPEGISFIGGHLQVRVSDGHWADVFPGWWVTRHADGRIVVCSGDVMAADWRKADGLHAGA